MGVARTKKPIPEAVSMDEIYILGRQYKDPRIRALFFFCYLTGARISEALATTPKDINRTSSQELGDYITVRLLTRKNKRIPIRDVPVPLRHREGEMMAYMDAYLNVERPARGSRNFGYLTRTNAWNRLSEVKVVVRALHGRDIIEKYERGINPHYLRHCRLTHLVQHYGFNEIQLMRFAGWTNTKPATVYVHLNWMDLAKVMTNAVNGDIFAHV